jgi:hypothetical protein
VDAVRERDGLETRVDAKGPKDAANVVPDRLQAEVQLLRDLIGRVTLFQQSQNLGLAWRQARMRRRRRGILFNLLDLAEDADHVAPALKRHATHLHRDALSVGRQENGSIVRAPRRAHEVTKPRALSDADNFRHFSDAFGLNKPFLKLAVARKGPQTAPPVAVLPDRVLCPVHATARAR